ncbi:MAG: ATP-binding protein, partial [Bacteroidota bacterium]|nr:ATP-binding protein [Bacteroidota bacterium]
YTKELEKSVAKKTKELSFLNINLEERIEANTKQLKKAEEIAQMGFMQFYLEKNYVEFSDEALRLFGLDDKSRRVTLDAVGEMVYPEDRKMVLKKFFDCNNDNISFNFDHRIIKKDGSVIWVNALGEAIHDSSGQVSVLNTIIDITDRKEMEFDLSSALEKAKESDRIKTAFLATMSHELRTPLNAIIGFSEIIDSELSPEELNEYSLIIYKSGIHLLDVIEDIFQFSDVESGNVKFELEEFSMLGLKPDLEEVFKVAERKSKKNCDKIKFVIKDSETDFQLFTDRQKLIQLMSIFVDNAVKFTEKGFVTISYKKISKKEIEFSVSDTGIGVPNDKKDIIFKEFRQADDSDTRVYGGTGIGLAISKRLVEMLGGKVGFESEKQNGSRFWFSLPCINVGSKKAAENDGDKDAPDCLAGKTIIVAEDEEVNFFFLKTLLIKEKVIVIYAYNGKEAVRAFKENPNTDLILMDLKMPEMDGCEATKEIRSFNKEILIIAVSAYARKQDRERAVACGCNDFITKPINRKLFMQKIKFYLT